MNKISPVVEKLIDLVEKKHLLRAIIAEIEKEKKMFVGRVAELKTNFLRSDSEEEKKQLIKEGNLLYQKLDESVSILLNRAKMIQI